MKFITTAANWEYAYAILNDGFSTIIDFPEAGVTFYEKEVTPPALDGGGPNDTTTMRNTQWRTRQPKHLITADKVVVKAAYDAALYTSIVDNLNVNQSFLVTFPDGMVLQCWGWLNKFAPDAHKEGEQPTAEIEIIISNQDDSGNEVGPIIV